ncbi:MAG: class I mannose-6-phosphate isomerase, partial [Oscillospiraceae bacterium]|nr:class I mannose-6-phosphate isomerase [Oscillospiraceae bacterium]
HKGDVFYIPAGTVHAVGKGTLIAEIQENSNVTYRVYDYHRKDKNGNLRELHLEKALQVMQMRPAQAVSESVKTEENLSYSVQELCHCRYFNTDKIQIKESFLFSVAQDSFQVLLCIGGNGYIQNQKENLSFRKGDCLFLPAGLGNCLICGNTEMLKIKC